MNLNLKQKTILAALLHDIGKIWERCESKSRGKHTDYTKYILKDIDEELAEIAYGHHRSSSLNTLKEVKEDLRGYAEIVCEADSISSGAEREKIGKEHLEEWTGRDRRSRPMLSILTTIDVGKGDSSEMYMDVRDLTLKPYYLRPKSLAEAIVDYTFSDNFEDDLKKVFNKLFKNSKDFNKLIFTLLHVLKKYLFFVPSDTYEREGKIPIPDTSLYEHLRLSSMFACAMLENREKFVLIRGDISGLQRFISKISYKRALRFLKGRSFFLELLNLASALKICKELDIPPTQILSASAGNFTIIAPLNDKIEKLPEIVRDMNTELLNYDLYLAVAWIEKKYKEAEDFEKIIDEIEEKVEEKKLKKYYEIISDYDKIFETVDGLETCEVCKSRVKDVEEIVEGEEEKLKVCERCKKIYELSEKLVVIARMVEEAERAGKVKQKIYLGIYENGGGDIEIFGIGFKLDIDPNNLKDADYVYVVNDVDFLEDVFLENGVGCGFRFFNVHVRDTRIDDLAEVSTGAKYIGILKMDGDDMGKVFSEGIRNWWKKRGADAGKITPSRYATLSSMLEIFFGYCVHEICRKGYFFTTTKYANNPSVYVIFSGGDDLFVLGPWDQIINLAIKIWEEYRIFTGHNPNLTVSASVTITRKKFPVYKSYFTTLDRLEQAKSLEGKSAIYIFGQKIKFDRIEEIIKLKDSLYERIRKDELPRSIIFALLRSISVDPKYRRKWKAKYVIARYKERYGGLDDIDDAIDVAFKSNDFSNLIVTLRWVELLSRR